MSEEKGNNYNRNWFFKRVDDYKRQSEALNREFESAEKWIVPDHEVERQALEPNDLRSRYVKTILTLGIGPTIAKLREKNINEQHHENNIKYLKASFLYVMSQQKPVEDPEKIKQYNTALDRLLELAISNQYMPIISRLVNNFGVVPNGSHMFLSVISNSEKILQYLIDHGGNPDFKGKRQTILQIGLLRGPERAGAVVDELLKQNVDVNTVDSDGKTALHYAAPYFSRKVIQDLITKNADVNAATNDGSTPLHYAMLADKENIDVVDTLLENNAKVNAKDNRGRSAMAQLVQERVFPKNSDELERMIMIMQKLFEYGANPNVQDSDGNTMLHYLCQHCGESHERLLLIKYLLSQNSDPNVKNNKGETPLHYAALALNPNQIRILLDHGADFASTTHKGKMPVNYVSKWDKWAPGLFQGEIDNTMKAFEESLSSEMHTRKSPKK